MRFLRQWRDRFQRNGICHSYAPDEHCAPLPGSALTNACGFDCSHCIRRHTPNVHRVRFTVQKAFDLSPEFYRRNHIKNLLLASGLFRSRADTNEMPGRIARRLRTGHAFRGDIHLKTIPETGNGAV